MTIYDYPKLSNKFIKLQQMPNHAISRKSESRRGLQGPELSLSENAMLKGLS